jgi:TIR domain
MTRSDDTVDFALSYAGEDVAVAQAVEQQLRELSFTVFLADDQRARLAGADGETFFEQLFTDAKQVVVFISRHYRAKPWPRFEWDVIGDRDVENRFIPVRLDDTRILGLPSNVFYVPWNGDNLQEVIDACVEQLLLFERDTGITRPTAYDRVLAEILNGSKGSLAKAYQLVKDGRQRDPLADADMPTGSWVPQYLIAESGWSNYSQVRRRLLKVRLPDDLAQDEMIFNLKHCCITEFNALKPDAVSVCGYSPQAELESAADLGVVEFAPFGEWGKVEEGLAYNLPTSLFEFRIRLP